jgi:hypothetical protein
MCRTDQSRKPEFTKPSRLEEARLLHLAFARYLHSSFPCSAKALHGRSFEGTRSLLMRASAPATMAGRFCRDVV